MSHSDYKLHMTIKPHLFYSFMVHALALAYLLSIPVYIGSEFSMTFGSYSVDLVSEERPAEKPARGYEPSKSRVLIFKKQESQAKAEVKSVPEAAPGPEVGAEEKGDEAAVIPSGISMLDEKPKEETLLAKSDIEVQEHKQEAVKEMSEMPADEPVTKGEEKAEPVNPEPVREETPPTSKPQPEAIKKEILQVHEPKAVHVADEKPSKADKTDEQLQEQFPVKPDEKAPEVSPLTVKEKTLLPKKPPAEPAKEESPPLNEAEKPIAAGAVSEKKEETSDKKTGEGEGKGKDREVKEDIKDTSKSLTGEKAGTERAVTEPKSKNRRLEKGIGDNEKKSEEKGLKIASPLSGELFGKGGDSSGTAAGDGTQTSTGSSGPQGDASRTGGGKAQMDGTGTKIAKESAEKKPAMGIVIPLLGDIKVEVFLHGTDGRVPSSQLYRRTHPSDEEDRRSKEQEIRLIKERDNEGKTTFYVAKAGKGIYTLVMTNNSEMSQKTDLVIRLLEGKKGARNRKFETVELAPHAEVKIKFILPEAVFWDDDSYFTGMAESSESISKFNEISGIVWKEEKE